jgi:hypothetical protein
MKVLRREDPNYRYDYAEIVLRRSSDEEWSRALSRNKVWKKICFYLGGAGGRNWDSVLRVVLTRDILEEVTLWAFENPPEMVTRFLQSMQLNPVIHTVTLSHVQFAATALAHFLDAATSVTTLEMRGCCMEASDREQGVIALAAAIQRNVHIRKLSLIDLDFVCLSPILDGLASNSHVKELEMCLRNPSREASNATKHLMESTASIESFKLTNLNGCGEFFLPIAQGLINSESVTDMAFDGCRFRNQGCARLFKGILQSKTNIRSLRVLECQVEAGELSAEDFINLLRPDALCRSFELRNVDLDAFGFTSLVEFKALLEAVAKNPLESFSIGCIKEQSMCRELISSIPKLQVRTLQFTLADSLERFKGRLLCAVKANASLHRVDGERYKFFETFYLFDEDDERKLNCYVSRNESLSQWSTFPPSMPKEAWPKALAAVRVTGPHSVYRMLQVLGNSVGPLEGKRKRKRPM